MPVTPILQGARLCVRPLALVDVPALAAILAEPSVQRWWGEPEPDDLERPDDGDLLVVGVAGAVAGLIHYAEVDSPKYRSAGIDIVLGRDWQGRGFGRESVALLVGHLIE